MRQAAGCPQVYTEPFILRFPSHIFSYNFSIMAPGPIAIVPKAVFMLPAIIPEIPEIITIVIRGTTIIFNRTDRTGIR